jgi:Sec7-like guanine-nucleotide exchange factor
MRQKIRQLYDSRADSNECQAHAEKYTEKLIEYQWHRINKKQERNSFMELIRAVVEKSRTMTSKRMTPTMTPTTSKMMTRKSKMRKAVRGAFWDKDAL